MKLLLFYAPKELKFVLDLRIMTFLTLAKVRSFTRAGEILNLTQPAVSQHIKYLEDYYGVVLFNKQGRYIDLTEEGKLLLNYAQELESLYKNLEFELKNKNSIHKTYNIGASMTIGGYVLPYILAKHKDFYKNVDIKLHVHNTKEIMESLINREIDLALVEGPFDKDKFNYKKFKDDELVLAVSPKNNLVNKKEVTLKDVLYGNLLLREKGSGTRVVFEDWLAELGWDLKDFNPYMELGSISAIKSLVELDLGYTIISKETVKKEIASGTIKTLPIRGVKIYRDFNFVYMNNCDIEFVDRFMDFCFTLID